MPDPRSFTVKTCTTYGQARGTSSPRRDVFGAAGKIGDLAVLNSVGAGKIGQGLRVLSSVSNTIRGGCGSLPTSIGGVLAGGLEAGAAWVLANVGIARPIVEAVRDFNPGIANQALGQATAIFQKVKQGNFKITDIPGVLQDLQNLERLGRNIFTPGRGDANVSLRDVCDASPYAIDLIARAPKHKFMFVVQIVPQFGYDELSNMDLAFAVKQSTRPNVKYIADDVNYYNYRSKVITKAEFEEMNMTFYDDMLNNAANFHAAYIKAMSPIANFEQWSGTVDFENGGMKFDNTSVISNTSIPTNRYASTTGPLLAENKTVLQEIRLFHLFDGGRKMNVYKFFNPRIVALTLDDLDMTTSGDGTSVQINFVYDSVFIATDVSFESGELASNAKSGQLRSAQYPLRYNSAATATRPANPGIAPSGTPAAVNSSCDTKINNRSPM